MKNKIHLYLSALVFMLSGLYLLPFINLYQGGDEGFLLRGAQRLLRGETIYRDFHSFLAPGSFVLLALLFKFFGVNILVARMATLLTGALLAAFTYLLAEKLLKHRYLALLPPFMVLVAGFPDWFLYSHHWLSSLLALVAVYLLVGGEEAGSPPGSATPGTQRKERWLYFLAGLFSAFTFSCMQSKGLLLILALLAYLGFFSPRRRPHRLQGYLAGTLGGLALLFLYLLGAGTLKDFLYYTWVWPFTHYAKANAVPYFNLGRELLWQSLGLQKEALLKPSPLSLLNFLFYSSETLFLVVLSSLSILAIPLALLWGWKTRKRDPFSREGSLLYLYALASLAFFLSSWHRPDILHLIYGASLPFIIFFYFLQKGIAASKIFQPGEKTKFIRLLGGLVLMMMVILLGINTFSRAEDNLLKPYRLTRYALINARGRQWTYNAAYAQDYNVLIPYLKARLKPQEPFFALYRQSMVYFFLDAYNPTPLDIFYPENINPEQLKQILDIIKQKKPRYILKDGWAQEFIAGKHLSTYPHAPLEAYKQEPIGRYVEENYQPVLVLNHFTLYQRKD